MYYKNLFIPFTILNWLKRKELNVIDYPLYYYINKNAQEENFRYCVRILNWTGFVGFGSNFAEALSKIEKTFYDYKKNNILPKPWERKSIEFASDDILFENEEFAADFFEKILGIDFYEGFFADEVTIELILFPWCEKTPEEVKEIIIKKTKENYGVDISNMYDNAIADIIVFIKNNMK